MNSIALKTFVGLRQTSPDAPHFAAQPRLSPSHRKLRIVAGKFSPKVQGRNLRVAVVGGGPAGGAAAETLAKGGVETFLIERKLDNCKPCGGAIPLCMVGEFDLPLDIIDRRVTKMKMISPSNVAVDIGRTLKPHEYIGMVRREVLDAYLRERAKENGANVINGLFMKMDIPKDNNSPYVLHYSSYDNKVGGAGEKCTLEVDAVIGADGANSRVAKSIDAGEYEYAIAFQVLLYFFFHTPQHVLHFVSSLVRVYKFTCLTCEFITVAWFLFLPKVSHVVNCQLDSTVVNLVVVKSITFVCSET